MARKCTAENSQPVSRIITVPQGAGGESSRRQAQSLLCHKLTEGFYRHIIRTVRNRDDADEIFQELVVRVLARPKGTENVAHFSAWCWGLVRHLLHRHFRNRRRRNKLLGELQFLAESSGGQMVPDPEQLIAAREVMEKTLGQLDAKSRELLLMHHFLGESAEDIAARTAQSSASIRMRLMRSRLNVRRSA